MQRVEGTLKVYKALIRLLIRLRVISVSSQYHEPKIKVKVSKYLP